MMLAQRYRSHTVFVCFGLLQMPLARIRVPRMQCRGSFFRCALPEIDGIAFDAARSADERLDVGHGNGSFKSASVVVQGS